METAENKYITVAYKLYTMEDGEKELFEEAKAEHPFQFISGLGTTLEDFENQITSLVVEIKPDVVVVDLNHPLAGADLIFEGEIIESRPATNEEIQELIKLMSGEGCGCGCDSCGGGCGDNECDDCGCEGGHCHK